MPAKSSVRLCSKDRRFVFEVLFGIDISLASEHRSICRLGLFKGVGLSMLYIKFRKRSETLSSSLGSDLGSIVFSFLNERTSAYLSSTTPPLSS